MNPKVIAAIVAPLLAAGGATWFGLRSGECVDVAIVCEWSEKDGEIILSPHEESITVRGEIVPEKVDPGNLKCTTTKVGEKYSCSIVGAAFTRLSDDKLADGCACSDGSGGCEMPDPASDPKDPKWIRAPKSPLTLSAGTWRGTCVAKQCVEHAELITGIGAVNPLSYSSPVACGGPGKRAPSGGKVPDALVQAAKVDEKVDAEKTK